MSKKSVHAFIKSNLTIFQEFGDWISDLQASAAGKASDPLTVFITPPSILDLEDRQGVERIAKENKWKQTLDWLVMEGHHDHNNNPIDLKSFQNAEPIYKDGQHAAYHNPDRRTEMPARDLIKLSNQFTELIKNPNPMCHLYSEYGVLEDPYTNKSVRIISLIDIADIYAEKMYWMSRAEISKAFSEKRLRSLSKQDYGDAKARTIAKQRFEARWAAS